jgi:hypothetical protein
MGTLSEQLFEQLCDIQTVQWERIATTSTMRTPDYAILLGSTKVIIEVKQLDLSKADRQTIKAWSQGGSLPTAFASNAHKRVRNIIGSASDQLRRLAKGSHPSIIVLFDNTQGFSYLDLEDILNAMYGDETVSVRWPNAPATKPVITGHHFGGHRKMTPEHNRSVSGLGLLRIDSTSSQPFLTLFHNIHAEIALLPEIATQLVAKQYTLDKDGLEHYQFWREIHTHTNDIS